MSIAEMKKPVQDEIEMLTKKRDQLKIDIENMRNIVNQETEQKVMSARKLASDVDERRKALDVYKKDLEGIALQVRKDKQDIETSKAEINAFREDSNRQMEKVGAFILLVRREAEKL